MRWMENFLRKFRKTMAERSHTCDACGSEVFSYPSPRLCKECLSSLTYNDGSFCDKCGRPTRGAGVCNACKEHPPAFERAAAPLAYFDRSALLVNRFKNGKRYLSYYFAEEMAKALGRLPKREYTLVAVPLTANKQRLRGYNQAEELIEHLAELTGYAAKIGILEKRKDNEQKQLSAKERRENIVGAFRVVDRKFCKGKDFLIVDDVMTSGATISEIASILLRAGANSVCAVCIAAVPDRDYVSVEENDQRNLLASM